ncbi:MAG: Gfo/Idh/MocA family oxidoreductase [Acidobacteriota bacterium]|nr:Gfo/Idh/MocA family oxidoreductase [Acidobacteriota bacterium]
MTEPLTQRLTPRLTQPTRRDSLMKLAAALGSAALLPAQSPNDTIRVAFIGVGNRGSSLLKNMLKVPGVKVVAICDIDPERLKAALAAAGGADGLTEYRKLLDRKDIDAVVIATPVDLHKEMAVAALEVGKNVYCEKPMGLTPEQCRMVANAAASAKGIFQAGFQLRHDPNRAASMKLIKEGGIGRVLFLQSYRHTGDLPHDSAWYFDRTRSGDNIVEQACHIIDLMVWAAGSHPLRAFGSGGINLYKDDPPGRTTMDNYSVIYEFPNDIRFEFSQIYFDPPGFSGIKERVYGSDAAIDLATATVIQREKRGEKKLEVPGAGEDSTYLSLAAFIDNARGKKKPLNNAESARVSTLTAMLGRKSIYERRVAMWEEVDV